MFDLEEKNGTQSGAQIEAFEDTWHWRLEAEAAYHEVVRKGPKSLADLMQALRSFLGQNDMMAYLMMMAIRLVEMDRVLEDFETRAPAAIEILENGFEDATAVFSLPPKYRRRLRTTNGLERLNVEVRRRERVIRIFPNRQSTIRLLGALLMEHDEQWSTGKRYLDMSEYYENRKLKPDSESKVTLMR